MISGHYMANTLREHRVFFVFAFLLIGVFQVQILALLVGADLLGMVEVFYRQLPPAIRALLGDQFFAQFSVDGAVAFGYIHPLVLTVSIIFAILLPARHIAGEVETGTLELVFALPLRRSTISLSLWLFSGMALLGLVIGGWIGSGVGLWLFPEARGVPVWGIAKAGISLWLLLFAISSYTLALLGLRPRERPGHPARRRPDAALLFPEYPGPGVASHRLFKILHPFPLPPTPTIDDGRTPAGTQRRRAGPCDSRLWRPRRPSGEPARHSRVGIHHVEVVSFTEPCKSCLSGHRYGSF